MNTAAVQNVQAVQSLRSVQRLAPVQAFKVQKFKDRLGGGTSTFREFSKRRKEKSVDRSTIDYLSRLYSNDLAILQNIDRSAVDTGGLAGDFSGAAQCAAGGES